MVSMVQQNLSALQSEIADKSATCALSVAPPRLIAVSKRQPRERIDEALDVGHRLFGENQVQEAQARWSRYKESYPDLSLHLIGPLQSNKAKEAVALFDVIHTIDRAKIADAVKAEMDKQDRAIACLVQVNVGEEAQKSGVMPQQLDALLEHCRSIGLGIGGLMCIPPENENPGPYFALLHKLAAQRGLKELSMGMSGDYMEAVRFGATYIRVGTGVFGARVP